MSTCLTIDCGRTLRSNDDTPPRVPAGPARRPLSRTSVRLAPRPRRSMVCAPGPPLVTKLDEIAAVIWVEPAAIGDDCRVSPRLSLPSRWAVVGSIRETGSGLVNSGDRMRVPVTTISFGLRVTAVSPSPATLVAGGSVGGWSLPEERSGQPGAREAGPRVVRGPEWRRAGRSPKRLQGGSYEKARCRGVIDPCLCSPRIELSPASQGHNEQAATLPCPPCQSPLLQTAGFCARRCRF